MLERSSQKKEDVVNNVQKMLAKLAHEAFDLNLLDYAKREDHCSLCPNGEDNHWNYGKT